ncbi:hypothetical protein JB92DRAFT_2802307, partial [Gautieria morchelliformis]
MASSVSSKHAFSSSGITITKWWNRLKGDVVEVLQVVKCRLKTKLILRDSAPSSYELELMDEGPEVPVRATLMTKPQPKILKEIRADTRTMTNCVV